MQLHIQILDDQRRRSDIHEAMEHIYRHNLQAYRDVAGYISFGHARSDIRSRIEPQEQGDMLPDKMAIAVFNQQGQSYFLDLEPHFTETELKRNTLIDIVSVWNGTFQYFNPAADTPESRAIINAAKLFPVVVNEVLIPYYDFRFDQEQGTYHIVERHASIHLVKQIGWEPDELEEGLQRGRERGDNFDLRPYMP